MANHMAAVRVAGHIKPKTTYPDKAVANLAEAYLELLAAAKAVNSNYWHGITTNADELTDYRILKNIVESSHA